MRSVVWSAGALADLEEILDYIARDKPLAARRWSRQLAALADRAAQMPFAGRLVPEYQRTDVREYIKRGYRVIYSICPDHIIVVAVIEGHRQLPSDLLDR